MPPKKTKTTTKKTKPSKVTNKKNSSKKSNVENSENVDKSVNSSEQSLAKDNNINSNYQSEVIEKETDYRTLLLNYDISKNKSRPILTSYEKTLIIGKRATQLSFQAQEYIDVKLGMTPIDIAEEELKQKKIPFMLKRSYGNQVDYWKLEDLFINSN